VTPSTTLDAIADRAAAEGLAPLGAFHPAPEDGAPDGCATLVLLGPDEPGFWSRFSASPEAGDGAAHPLDRWSRRVVGGLAGTLGAAALFPFGGPPWLPFIAWALRSGRSWTSPVGLLVHDTAGLFVSYRGALAFAGRIDLPGAGLRPCDACAAPCFAACPVGALTGSGYDVAACHGYLDTGPGGDCMGRGCAVRRACPVGQDRRVAAQSAFHMADFHGKERACDA
jgi:hypothetical protein